MYSGYSAAAAEPRRLPALDDAAGRFSPSQSTPASPHQNQHHVPPTRGYQLPPLGPQQQATAWPSKALGSTSYPPASGPPAHDPYVYPQSAERHLYSASPDANVYGPGPAAPPGSGYGVPAVRSPWHSSNSGDESATAGRAYLPTAPNTAESTEAAGGSLASAPRSGAGDVKGQIPNSEGWIGGPSVGVASADRGPAPLWSDQGGSPAPPPPTRHSMPHVWTHGPDQRAAWGDQAAASASSAYDVGSRPGSAPQRRSSYQAEIQGHPGVSSYSPYGAAPEAPGFVWTPEHSQGSEYGYRFPGGPHPGYGAVNAQVGAIPSGLTIPSGEHVGYAGVPFAGGPAPSRASGRSTLPTILPGGGRKKKRELQEVDAICNSCHHVIAKLMLRGTWEEMRVEGGFEPVHTCKACRMAQGFMPIGAISKTASNSANGSSDSDGDPPGGEPGPKRLRNKMMSAPGRDPPPPFSDHAVTPAPLRLKSTVATFRKRNRRTDDMTAPTICDCCLRELGAGGIVPRNGRSAIQFAVEIVCYHCLARYRRCTDCGGGGGARLGVGKWRAKELFADGRRTCALSHQRQGLPDEIDYYVWRARDVPRDELEQIIGMIRSVLRHSLMSGLAIPEIMETGLAHISCFQDIENLISNGWSNAEKLLREDIEPTRQRRRYVGLRWAKPHPRKGPRPPDPAELEALAQAKPPHESALRPGLELTGFILAEWDMDKGSVFIPVVVPWQMGDNFEATGSLCGHLLKRIWQDRDEIVQRMRRDGRSEASIERQYPIIEHTWTMMFFAREARPVHYLEKRREYLPLEDYLEAHPDVSPSLFAPIRDCYVPVESQAGWQILVRRQSERTLEDWEKRIVQAQKQAIGRSAGRRGAASKHHDHDDGLPL